MNGKSMIRKMLFSAVVITGTALSAGETKSLYNFDNNTTQGWWMFKGGSASLTLSAAAPGADNTAGAMKAVFNNGKPGSYLGIGIQPKWALGGKADFSPYASGALLIAMKSDSPINVKIEIRMDNKETYSTKVDVGSDWKSYTLKFSEFTCKDKPLALTADCEVSQIVIIPKGKAGDHTLFIDEIKAVTAVP